MHEKTEAEYARKKASIEEIIAEEVCGLIELCWR